MVTRSRVGAVSRSRRLETESGFGRPRNVARCRRRSKPARLLESEAGRAAGAASDMRRGQTMAFRLADWPAASAERSSLSAYF